MHGGGASLIILGGQFTWQSLFVRAFRPQAISLHEIGTLLLNYQTLSEFHHRGPLSYSYNGTVQNCRGGSIGRWGDPCMCTRWHGPLSLFWPWAVDKSKPFFLGGGCMAMSHLDCHRGKDCGLLLQFWMRVLGWMTLHQCGASTCLDEHKGKFDHYLNFSTTVLPDNLSCDIEPSRRLLHFLFSLPSVEL